MDILTTCEATWLECHHDMDGRLLLYVIILAVSDLLASGIETLLRDALLILKDCAVNRVRRFNLQSNGFTVRVLMKICTNKQ